MSWVMALSLLCVLLVALAWCGMSREHGMWKVAVAFAALAVGLQALSGLQAMAEPYRLQYWQLNWLAVAGAAFLCIRGLLWKLWI